MKTILIALALLGLASNASAEALANQNQDRVAVTFCDVDLAAWSGYAPKFSATLTESDRRQYAEACAQRYSVGLKRGKGHFEQAAAAAKKAGKIQLAHAFEDLANTEKAARY